MSAASRSATCHQKALGRQLQVPRGFRKGLAGSASPGVGPRDVARTPVVLSSQMPVVLRLILVDGDLLEVDVDELPRSLWLGPVDYSIWQGVRGVAVARQHGFLRPRPLYTKVLVSLQGVWGSPGISVFVVAPGGLPCLGLLPTRLAALTVLSLWLRSVSSLAIFLPLSHLPTQYFGLLPAPNLFFVISLAPGGPPALAAVAHGSHALCALLPQTHGSISCADIIHKCIVTSLDRSSLCYIGVLKLFIELTFLVWRARQTCLTQGLNLSMLGMH